MACTFSSVSACLRVHTSYNCSSTQCLVYNIFRFLQYSPWFAIPQTLPKNMCRWCNIDTQTRKCASRPIEWATNYHFRIARLEVMSVQRYEFSYSIKFYKRAFSTKLPPANAVNVIVSRNVRMHNRYWRRSVWAHFCPNRMRFSVGSAALKIRHAWTILLGPSRVLKTVVNLCLLNNPLSSTIRY